MLFHHVSLAALNDFASFGWFRAKATGLERPFYPSCRVVRRASISADIVRTMLHYRHKYVLCPCVRPWTLCCGSPSVVLFSACVAFLAGSAYTKRPLVFFSAVSSIPMYLVLNMYGVQIYDGQTMHEQYDSCLDVLYSVAFLVAPRNKLLGTVAAPRVLIQGTQAQRSGHPSRGAIQEYNGFASAVSDSTKHEITMSPGENS